jgi:hypothetical protein
MAGDCRILFADQEDYANNLGFYLDLEATTEADGQCHLDTLTMYTGVADGSGWRYLPFQPSWQYGHQYQVVVTIAPSYTDVQVDGVLVQHSPGGFRLRSHQTRSRIGRHRRRCTSSCKAI